MFQETCLYKRNNNKDIIDSERAIKIRNLLHKTLMLLAKTNIKYKLEEHNELKKIDGRPTIYVLNHYSAQDTPIACELLNDRAYILAGVQNLGFVDNLFFWLNGSIFVDRKDKIDMNLSKDAMIGYLKKDIPLIYFPEGTWNLSDNLLMLNMKWGIIDVAKEVNAQIVPIILDYDRKNMICNIEYGNPFLPELYDDKKQAIDKLRDYMATIRWSMMEKGDTIKRNNMDVEYYKSMNSESINEFPKIDIDYESSVIYEPYVKKEEVFAPVKKLEIKKENAFMFYKGNKGM